MILACNYEGNANFVSKLTQVSVFVRIYLKLMHGVKIVGWGSGLPKRAVTNFDLEKLFDTSDDWIFQRTGIKERRIVDYAAGETAVSLGAQAAQEAMASSAKYHDQEIKAEDIDLIICATATGDYLFPTTACLIQDQLQAHNAVAYDLSAACSGFIFALNSAYNYIKLGQYKNVLVVGVDLMSRFTDWSDRRTAILFGDGAGACLLTSSTEDNFKSFYLKSKGDKECVLNVPNKGGAYPLSAEQIKEKPQMVYMDGQAVYQFAVKAVPEALENACALAHLEPQEIDWFVPHQANMRIIQSAARRFKIPLEKFICNIERFGNTSAASIPIAMHEALEKGIIKYDPNKKQKIAMVGFGAGLTWGACVAEF
jgi:3-oxoacyl-[acyl-carrier-protein] synthase-3